MLGCERRAAVRPSPLPRKITDMPPVPISRSRINLPPKRLTVGRVPFRPSLNYLSAHGAREGLQTLAKTQERLDGERLLSVAEGLLGLVVGLHNQAVRLRRYARLAQRNDQVAPSCRVGRIHDHRQVREPLRHDYRREVQREARARLERAYPALAEDHVVPPGARYVLRCQEPLLDRR